MAQKQTTLGVTPEHETEATIRTGSVQNWTIEDYKNVAWSDES